MSETPKSFNSPRSTPEQHSLAGGVRALVTAAFLAGAGCATAPIPYPTSTKPTDNVGIQYDGDKGIVGFTLHRVTPDGCTINTLQCPPKPECVSRKDLVTGRPDPRELLGCVDASGCTFKGTVKRDLPKCA